MDASRVNQVLFVFEPTLSGLNALYKVVYFLPFVLGEYAKFHGHAGAAVVATEAACAVLVLPDDFSLLVGGDVVLWTSTHTAFATDAVLVGVEVFVGDEEAVEEGTEHIGLEPGEIASHHFGLVFSALDAFCDGGNALQGLFHLRFCHFVLVDVKAWETDVGVGHVDRDDQVGFPS